MISRSRAVALQINQSGSDVGGSQIGHYTDNSDRRTYNSIASREPSAITAFAERLELEVAEQLVTSEIVPSLSFYKKRRSPSDGIVGLDAKLKEGNRDYLIEDALELKIEFDKLLDKWSLYPSAQQIFAHLLALISKKVARKIVMYHRGELIGCSAPMVDDMIDNEILIPITNQCGDLIHFQVNLDIALGMLYWLADNCFIKWHK